MVLFRNPHWFLNWLVRVVFKEVPRVGSTFVGFAYIGSDADVTRSEVVPPIESGDFLDIQGETVDREVAVIESANTLVTFEYIGSIFGRDAQGEANILKGRIDGVPGNKSWFWLYKPSYSSC